MAAVVAKKEILAAAMFASRLSGLVCRTPIGRLVVFGYHRVTPDDGPGLAYAEDVAGLDAQCFEAQLRWVQKYARIIALDELLQNYARGRRPTRTSVLLTFDDGYRDNYTVAYPIMKRLGVPATFFVPTKLIEERSLGWWDVIAHMVKRCSKGTIELDGQRYDLVRQRDETIDRLHKRMQLEYHEQTAGLLDRLAETTGVDYPSRESADAELMTWDQLREVADNGISVQSHTHTHRTLASLDPELQREELTTSRRIIEERIGRPVRTVAYPVGKYVHFNAHTPKVAADCGYELGFSFCTGGNAWGGIDPFDVRRVGVPSSISMVAATAAAPDLFGIS